MEKRQLGGKGDIIYLKGYSSLKEYSAQLGETLESKRRRCRELETTRDEQVDLTR